jgi:hypothetical protein
VSSYVVRARAADLSWPLPESLDDAMLDRLLFPRPAPSGDARPLPDWAYIHKLVGSDDIWECRVQFGSNDYRILCFQACGSVLVLTNGLMKKTQKTPAKEIERAETCKRDYLRRHKRHERPEEIRCRAEEA